MKIIQRVLSLALLAMLLLVAVAECAPLQNEAPVDDSLPVQQYSRQELAQLFQEDAKFHSSSSHSRGHSSEELKRNVHSLMRALNITPVPTTRHPLLYQPMPFQQA